MKAKQAMAVILAASVAVSTAAVSAMAQDDQEMGTMEEVLAGEEAGAPEETEGRALQVVEGVTEMADEDPDAETLFADTLVLDAAEAADDGEVPADGIFSGESAPEAGEAAVEEDAEDTGDIVGALEEAIEEEEARADSAFLEQYKDCPVLQAGQDQTVLLDDWETKAVLVKPTETSFYEIRSSCDDQDADPFATLYDEEGKVLVQDDDGCSGIDDSYNYLIHVKLDAGKTYVLISRMSSYDEVNMTISMKKVLPIVSLTIDAEHSAPIMVGDTTLGEWVDEAHTSFRFNKPSVLRDLKVIATYENGNVQTFAANYSQLKITGDPTSWTAGGQNLLTVELDGVSTQASIPVGDIKDHIDKTWPRLSLEQPLVVHYDGTQESGIAEFTAPYSGCFILEGSESASLNAKYINLKDEDEYGLEIEEQPLRAYIWAKEGERVLIYTENAQKTQSADYILTLYDRAFYQTPGNGTEVHTHSFKWTATRQATVFQTGLETGTCEACGETQTRETAKLTPTVSLNVSGTLPLKKGQKNSSVRVSDLAAGDSVKSVESSKTKVVTVSEAGGVLTLKGKKTGKATITVTLASGKTVSFKVKVQKAEVKTKKISVAAKKVQLEKGQTFSLNALISPLTSKQKIIYSSSKSKVASVSRSGVITAKKKGKATITVKSGKKKVKIKVTVR